MTKNKGRVIKIATSKKLLNVDVVNGSVMDDWCYESFTYIRIGSLCFDKIGMFFSYWTGWITLFTFDFNVFNTLHKLNEPILRFITTIYAKIRNNKGVSLFKQRKEISIWSLSWQKQQTCLNFQFSNRPVLTDGSADTYKPFKWNYAGVTSHFNMKLCLHTYLANSITS